jgi:hypothetical protein
MEFIFATLSKIQRLLKINGARRGEEAGFYFAVCEYITRVRPSKRILESYDLGLPRDFLHGRDGFFRVFQFLQRFSGQERLRHLAILA